MAVNLRKELPGWEQASGNSTYHQSCELESRVYQAPRCDTGRRGGGAGPARRGATRAKWLAHTAVTAITLKPRTLRKRELPASLS
ncbi:unnamed protein product [Arctia plantaginis]|uniref:Uncharacterized protein n=1 Tax=Arctia plantaginis TaxID=874455 RepID=A0A8S0YNI8_ARCPL|nr:unnamed protein product [Arctia plantaginis]